MNIFSMLKPSRKKTIITIVLFAIYLVFIYTSSTIVCLAYLECTDKPHHTVMNHYPGSMCGQVCATSFELVLGYLYLFLLPLVILYLFVNFTIEGIHSPLKSLKK